MRFLRGQAAIALTLAIPMIVGAACIGADMRVLYRTSARLQQATDAAVLCGAAYLPANPALAEIAARSKARMSGIREDEIVYSRPASDRRSITMVVERKVPYRFARLLGLSQSLVTVKAMAATRIVSVGRRSASNRYQCEFRMVGDVGFERLNRSLENNRIQRSKAKCRISGAFSPSTV